MIYAHQHNNTGGVARISKVYSFSKNSSRPSVTEKCYLCDVMHHNAMVAASHLYFNPAVVTAHVFKKFEYSFCSIQLIISGGRAPPSA